MASGGSFTDAVKSTLSKFTQKFMGSSKDNTVRLKVDRDGAKKKFWIRPLSQESAELSIPFAEFNEQDLSLNPDALKLLETIDKPVAVLTVCGPFHSGKSYYLSRVLGIKSSFKSSPYPCPCTKGMWMATNVLECDDFVVILMDTEGTSSLERQDRENNVTSLMVLSTLLSSVLIYNSKGPASQNSLNEMSFFGQLAESFVIHDVGESVAPEEKCTRNFPNLLWLIRDDNLTCTDSYGISISPTEYIKTKILQPTGQTSATSAVSRALLTLFPSLECMRFPSPNTTDPAAASVESLQAEFNSAIDKSVTYILSKIKPRNGVNNNVELDGVLLAKLADQYRKALNVPNSVPNLEDSYQTAVKHKINEHSKILIECYKEEMEQKIPQTQYPLEQGNLDVTNVPSKGPITLFGIHNSVYQPKLNSLKMQVQKYMAGSNFNNAHRESVLNNFQDRICKIVNNKVKEGILYGYVVANLYESYRHCDHVFERLYSAQSEVNLRDITSAYNREAIGPAKTTLLEEKMSVIPKSPIYFTDMVEEVHSVKVNWYYNDPNLQDTVSYEVDVKMVHSSKRACVTFPKGSIPPQTVTDLSPNTTYILRIRACTSTRKGEYSQEFTVKTFIGIPGIPDKPEIILDLDHPSTVAIKVKKLSKEKLNGAEGIKQIIIEHSCHDDNDVWKESLFKVNSSFSSKSMKIPIELPTCPQECRCIYYRVRVVTAGGESEASDTEELFSADLIPGQPTNIKCSCDSEIKQAVLTWNAPETNSQSVNYYHIKVSRENGEEVYSREVTERRTVLNLRPATNYTVKLYACNHKKIKGTNSEFPIQMKAARPAKPKKPRIQVDNKDIRHAFLIVERPSNEEENGSAIKTIIVETAKGEDDCEKWNPKEYDFTTGDRNIQLKVELINATDNNTMYFRVIMVNSVGPSEPSHFCELECYQMIPGEAQNVKVHQATNNSVTLKWDEPQVNPKSVDYYCVQMMDKNVSEWVFLSPVRTLKEKSFTISNLCHNSPYEFRVLANNKDNESLPNGNVNIINTRTQPCPPKITVQEVACQTKKQDKEWLLTGSRVQIPTPSPTEPFKYGVIRWLGEIPEVQCVIAGIELDDNMDGCSDGTLISTGQKFFSCLPGRGIYYPVNNLQPDVGSREYYLRQWQETKCCQKQLEDKNVHLERENMVLESEKKSLESENKQLKREVWYLQQQLATFSQEIHSLRAAQQESIAFGIEPWKVGRDDVMLGRVIGGGGWGVVNQAKLQVAVKQFYPNILSERNLARLQREMRILALIRHPNLLQFIAAVFDENNEHEKNPPYIITELLDMSLRSAYEKNLLPRSSLLPVFMDTARALDYLHRRHEAIIHRDVSSANVLLKRHPNDKWVAKLSDLGSANLAQEAYTMNEGARVYLAPEAFTSSTDARSTGTLTPKVDVYSYGVVLCEVATSTFPEQAALSAMFVRVQREWHQLHRLIVACTNPDPTQRPSMASILSSLEQFPPK